MISKSSRKFALLFSLLLPALCFNALAFNNEATTTPVNIPKLDNAQVFADFTDDIPAVLNYFTRSTEEQVISFYKQHYGEIITQERKRGRLTLSFEQEALSMRVVISQQNNKRQVDVIVEKK